MKSPCRARPYRVKLPLPINVSILSRAEEGVVSGSPAH